MDGKPSRGGAYKGWMRKKGAALLQGYKRRWFEIHGKYLYYFKAPDSKPCGVLTLSGAFACDGKELTGFVLEGPQLSRRYQLLADSPAEKTHWMYHLSLAGVTCQSSDSLSAGGDTASTDTVTKDDFEVIRVLGRGSFGSVELAKRKTSCLLYAIKSVPKIVDKTEGTMALGEVSLLQRMKHPFIVALHYAFLTPTHLCLVLDYLSGGELFQHIRREGRFTEDRARFYAAEISCALDCLHLNNVVYRDLKPENCVLDGDGHVVLTDFGLAKATQGEGGGGPLQTFCGTHEYLAPEVLKGEGATKAVDWWSWGVLLFEMLTGGVPFCAEHAAKLYDMILTCEPVYPEFLSRSAVGLLKAVLVRDRGARLAAPAQHPFFADVDFDLLLAKKIEPPFRPPEDATSPNKLSFAASSQQNSASDDFSGSEQPDPFRDFTWNEGPQFNSF